VLDALALRHLAEKADGHRGERLCLIWRPEKAAAKDSEQTGFLVVSHDQVNSARPGAADEVLMEIETKYHDPRRAKRWLRGIYLEGDGIPPGNVATTYDALFWSEPAVEKFMFGYYLRNLNDEDWQKLYDAFVHPTRDLVIYAFAHLPDSTWTQISDIVTGSVDVFSSRGVHPVTEFLSFL
jgi:hypothetical protein